MSSADSQEYRGDNPLIRKLGRFVPLNDVEREALEEISRNARLCEPGRDLISEGDDPQAVFLIMKGWAYRYKQLADGSRQILAYLIPGDTCDIQNFLFEKMDHSIGLLCDAQVVKIPAAQILDIMDRFPRVERALMWSTLVDEATLREWLLNVGQRSALERIAHLFCELCVRLTVVGLVDDEESFTMPLTQAELADTTGMTAVHVNRTLQKLRKDGLVATIKGRLKIVDFATLAEISGFTENYLHTDGPPIDQRLRMRPNLSR
jgi:CRP-like cAMP-binding protein